MSFVASIKASEKWFCREFSGLIDGYGQEVCLYEFTDDSLYRGSTDRQAELVNTSMVAQVKCLISQTNTQSATHQGGETAIDGGALQEVECLFKRGVNEYLDNRLKVGFVFTTDRVLSGVETEDQANDNNALISYRVRFVTGLETLWHCGVIRQG